MNVDQIGVLDHHHGIGAAWQDAAGRDRRCRAAGDFDGRGVPAHDHLAVETQWARCGVAGAQRIGGAQCKPVDIGAIEGRNVDRRGHILREHASERSLQRDRLAGKRR